MSRKPIAFLLALALIGGSAALQPAAAQSPAADPDPWRFNVALYGWAINVSGNATIHNQTLDTNASTLDLLQKSDSLGGFMGYFEADKGRAGLYADLVYTNLGFGADRVGYRNPIFGLRITASASAALTYQMTIAEVGGVYELARWPGSEGSSTALDGVVAFRYWNNSLTANFDATANVNFSNLHLDRSFGLAVSGSSVVQWVDPVFGLRLRHRFTPNQEMFVRGDIGGFGLGSQFSWQAVAAYSYAWQLDGHQIATVLGFRALAVNYTSGSGVDTLGINEVFYGPIIGASFRF
jgi:hypothetical protein